MQLILAYVFAFMVFKLIWRKLYTIDYVILLLGVPAGYYGLPLLLGVT